MARSRLFPGVELDLVRPGRAFAGFKQRLESGDPPEELISEAGKELGDSVEKVLFINQAINKKEGR